MEKGKGWHIEKGVLFIGKEFRRGKGFLPWFDDRDRITGLVLEEGLEEVGREWCAYLKGLRTLELPHSLKIIASGAFEDCSGIREVIIPESVTEINNSAFYECTDLEKVILPESLTAIWEKAFRYCRSLREIIIPPNVWHITDDVFNDCPSLKKVIVRSKVLENMYWVPDGCEVIRED